VTDKQRRSLRNKTAASPDGVPRCSISVDNSIYSVIFRWQAVDCSNSSAANFGRSS